MVECPLTVLRLASVSFPRGHMPEVPESLEMSLCVLSGPVLTGNVISRVIHVIPDTNEWLYLFECVYSSQIGYTSVFTEIFGLKKLTHPQKLLH